MKQQRYQYMNKEQITAAFDIKQCTYFKVRKLIRLHPDRYTDYAIHDRLTDGNAFVDAKKYAKQLKNGDPLPAYDFELAHEALMGLILQ